ncbi:MAG: hypothetical protein NTY38_09805 [Acidobacteria bacterium]|nr:hypothetical protein [Acidobacteriota bacterium]
MGFALWVQEEMAWAQGTHEYRPMGTAVVAVTDTFQPRDFRPGRRSPGRMDPSFSGFFCSLSELNLYLREVRSRPGVKFDKGSELPYIPF